MTQKLSGDTERQVHDMARTPMIRRISSLIGEKNRRRLLALLPAMAFASLLEMAGLTMVVSVCTAFVGGGAGSTNPLMAWAGGFLARRAGNGPAKGLSIKGLLISLIILYLLKTIYIACENYMVFRFVRTVRNEVASDLCGRMIRGPYSLFIRHSQAELQNLLGQDTLQLAVSLDACMQLLMEVPIVLGMGACLFLTDPVMTAFVAGGIIVLLLLTRVILKRPIQDASGRQRDANRKRWKWLQQAVEGAKDIRVGGHEDFFEARFSDAGREYARSDYLKQFWTKLPALCIEAVMVLAVLLYLLFLVQAGKQPVMYLPSLSALAWTAVRLLPAFSRINAGLTQISYAAPSVEALSRAMEETELTAEKDGRPQKQISFRRGIVLRDVSFAYDGRPEAVLSGVDMEIPAGSAVGIVGPSGAGKTTLLDILLGLLTPVSGTVEIDGIPIEECYESYLKKAAYVPQDTFLMDGTIRDNVAMGVDEERISDEKVWGALEKAALSDMVKGLPSGLGTQVGERGVLFSGGERQRIGLARAMYADPEVVFFDEATSALDMETEAEVLSAINGLKGEKTLVIVSHRTSAISGCDRVYRVEGGKVRRER